MTALTLFDLTDLTPTDVEDCSHCDAPATTRVHAATNLLGTVPAYLGPTRYRHLQPITSRPCCDRCAWNLAVAWWSPVYACPHTGVCFVWLRTLADPRPELDCRRHHREDTVVWRTPIGGAA